MLPETRYAYAVARVRVAELNMLNRARLERMLESDTVDGALRVLHEAGYSESGDYEEILARETAFIYSYLREISPEPAMFDLFSYRYDSHNIKVLLKAEFSGLEETSMLVDNGVFDKNNLSIMIRDRELGKLPREFSDAIHGAVDAFSRTRDPQVIDILIDRAYYILFSRLAKEAGCELLEELAAATIDISNLNSFIRIKGRMEDLDLLSRILISGGKIPVRRYLDAFGADIDAFLNEVKGHGYNTLVEIAIENKGRVTEFEKACDNFIIKMVGKFRYKAFGIGPLVGYMLGKETDIKNARIILVGKTNRINNDIIRERLRDSYV
ncbi:MAG: V-type ATP synthase subunit C [Clostridia bacterium]|nr:V-type ATP synthase subunit C [Clostridia bacterium]MBN2882123.1 V-type ATP synthase subunit C [Clostridia bacterium]